MKLIFNIKLIIFLSFAFLPLSPTWVSSYLYLFCLRSCVTISLLSFWVFLVSLRPLSLNSLLAFLCDLHFSVLPSTDHRNHLPSTSLLDPSMARSLPYLVLLLQPSVLTFTFLPRPVLSTMLHVYTYLYTCISLLACHIARLLFFFTQ